MDKNSFTHIIRHFSGTSEEEAQEVLSLEQHYPYSQVLRVLSARVSKDHGFGNQQQALQLAAVYSSDRGVLKEIMTVEYNPDLDRVWHDVTTITEVKTEITSTSTSISDKLVKTTSDAHSVADDVIHDLERLSELKHDFEVAVADFSARPIELETEEKNAEKPTKPISKPVKPISKKEPVKEAAKKKSGLSKKQRIIALAKAADVLAEAEAKEKEDSTPGKKKENTGDVLIDEIANTKEEIDPKTEKQKKQIEIIDQFIKAQPSITNSKDKPQPAPSGDLSTTKSGEFGDNIVSETLVDILLKQGKKDKAIEVLKKLIWKFPQKKAYFAAQIEELKN